MISVISELRRDLQHPNSVFTRRHPAAIVSGILSGSSGKRKEHEGLSTPINNPGLTWRPVGVYAQQPYTGGV